MLKQTVNGKLGKANIVQNQKKSCLPGFQSRKPHPRSSPISQFSCKEIQQSTGRSVNVSGGRINRPKSLNS